MNDSISALLAPLTDDATMARTISVASKLRHIAADDAPLVKFAILRNITLEPGLPASLCVQSAQAGLRSSLYLGDFDTAQRDALAADGPLYAGGPDIVVIALRLQTLAPRLVLDYNALGQAEVEALKSTVLERVTQIVTAIRARSPATILVHNFELAIAPSYGILDARLPCGQQTALRTLNLELAAALREIPGCYIVDVEHLLACAGYEASLDDRYWHIGRAPYTFAFQKRLAAEYVKFAVPLKGKGKKCLVLDCDNTLWGGVVGEDGLSGIRLGATYPGSAFVEFQAAILDLYNRGILLAINSKNNEADVLEVFARHPDSLLKANHFATKRINWQDKAQNLRDIALELNIGLDSLVFVDDNPFEAQFVRETLPQVAVVELPPDPTKYARLLRKLPYFETLTLSDEDRRRTEMYQAQAERAVLKQSAGSMEAYLQSLDMVLGIERGDAFSTPRIAQLTQKTNQFNLTTRRYGENDIKHMIEDSAWRVYGARLVDKFDDAGLIAVALVHDRAGRALIDTFLMSCRVIGRGVEQALLARIAEDSRESGSHVVVGEFIPTAKNEIVAAFYEQQGFSPAGQRGDSKGSVWELSLDGGLPATPSWFRIARVDDRKVAV